MIDTPQAEFDQKFYSLDLVCTWSKMIDPHPPIPAQDFY